MGEPSDAPPKSYTRLEEVREERRTERTEAVTDPELRRELSEINARDKALSDLKQVQKERFPQYVQDIREQRQKSRLAPASTAEAEVTIQYEGWLKGEATRHNKIIDQKLDEYEEVHGKKVDWHRFANEIAYRLVVGEEGKAQPSRQISRGWERS